MAYAPQTVISLNPTLYPATAFEINANFLEGDNATPLNPSAWNNVTLETFVYNNGVPISIGTLALLPTFSTPTSTFTLTAANATSLCGSGAASGSVQFCIKGKPATGDDFEVIAQGTAFIQPVS